MVFEVENTLFRVPKIGFEVPGSFFETMFRLPGPGKNGEQLEGTDDKHPLPLEGISKAHFRGLLRVMYPFQGSASTYDEWVGVLHLATQWDLTEIRKKAISALSPLIKDKSAINNIILARKYAVKQWLINGYMQLLIHTKALDLDQLDESGLGLPTIARLFAIRESAHLSGNNHCYRCGRKGYDDIGEDDAHMLVSQNFAEELSSMEGDP